MTTNTPTLPSTGFIRQADLRKFVPVHRATIWRWIAADKFPRPHKLSDRVTAWKVEDVRAWFEARAAA